MKFILALLLCSPAYGQFTVSERASFTVTERAAVVADDEFYLVFYTASWCQPCQQFKTSGKLDRLKERMPVTVIDIDQQRQWKINRVPAFWLARRSDQTRVKVWTGSVTVEQIDAEIERIQNPVVASIYGRRGTSHESRESLINHLLRDGIHRGKWQLDALNAMSDDALDLAHNTDHGWTR